MLHSPGHWTEAEALGTTLDARRVLAALSGPVRPAMVEAVRRLDAAGPGADQPGPSPARSGADHAGAREGQGQGRRR